MKHIVLKPRMSEKAYQQSLNNNVYVFVVPNSANKLTVEKAVTSQFDVTVTNVRTVIQKVNLLIADTVVHDQSVSTVKISRKLT